MIRHGGASLSTLLRRTRQAGGPSMYYEVGDTVTFTDSGTGKTITGARIVAKVDHLLDGAPGFIAGVQKRRTWGLASEISYVAPRTRGR